MNLVQLRYLGIAAVLLAALAFVPNPVLQDLLFTLLLFAAMGQAWNWISGYAGQISFGHAIFFGVGAYAVALSNTRHGSPWYGALGGGLIAAILALAIGFPCFRLRGHYFSIATIAVGAIVATVVKTQDWLGRANGFEIAITPGFLNLQFTQKWPYVLLALVIFVVAQGLTIALERSRVGYYLRAIRANDAAAQSVGINERSWKLLAFAVSAFVTSVAGSLYAQYTLFVDPESVLSLSVSIDIALIGVVGGIGTLWGPAAGALVYVFLAKYVALQTGGGGKGYDLVIYGAIIVLIAALRPSGIVGFFIERARRLRATRSAA
ncbi:MAG: branched-chain amino acid ABC transporter permease [Candidatus Velthaea sp.]